jgi:hypothetical protein
MTTSETWGGGRRLTAAELKELEGLAFKYANETITHDEERRYFDLRRIEESPLRG